MRAAVTSRARLLSSLTALVIVLVVGVTALTPGASHADPIGECTSSRGAVVAVDFGHWGGPIVRGCDADPTTGMNLLHNSGFTTEGTVHDGPGFICRIGNPQFDNGIPRPTTADEPCTATPPASAYWSYWMALPGASTWSYSPLGALSDVPVDGEVEAWTFGATDIGGTTGQPDFTPDSVRAGGDATASPSPSVSPSVPASPSSSPSQSPSGPAGGADLAALRGYLEARLADGDHVIDPYFGGIDYGKTAQLGIDLAATGNDDATLAKVVTYLSGHVTDAIYPSGAASPPDPAVVSVIALLAEIVGADPHDFGGQNLIAALTGNICTATGSGGNCNDAGDFYGAFTPSTQALGVLALARAGDVPQAAVTALATLQCGDGGFAAAMIRAGDFCFSEHDVTGLAAEAFTAIGSHADILGAARKALLAAQQPDGGFLPYEGAVNSDTSTSAVAGSALDVLGEHQAAAAALAYVVSQQQPDGGFADDVTTGGSDIFGTLPVGPAVAGTDLVHLSHPLPGVGPTSSPTSGPTPAGGPDLAKGSKYLVDPANLIDGHYYAPFGGGFADWGLTIDGAFALAATGAQNDTLRRIVDYIDGQGVDGVGSSIDGWTGIGTPFASGGSLGKEAVLAEVVGADPRDFSGHDLISALDASVCTSASTGSDFSCAAAGNYTYAASTFSQALGVIAQWRAGDTANAAAPIAYLESLQHADGSWPSLIPSTGDSDVDSTAMAVMALDLLPGAHDAVDKGVAWIASKQQKDGGFPGVAGDSINSAALAIQGMSLRAAAYQAQIAAAEAFLASQQNGDGGFNVAAGGQPGSDLRASAQAVGGAAGTSFGTLAVDLPPPPPQDPPTQDPTPSPSTSTTTRPKPSPTGTPHPAPTVTRTATGTATATSTMTATATAAVTPPPSVPPSAARGFSALAGAAPSVSATPMVSAADRTTTNPLWWLVIAVAVVSVAVVVLLYMWRRTDNGVHRARSGS